MKTKTRISYICHHCFQIIRRHEGEPCPEKCINKECREINPPQIARM